MKSVAYPIDYWIVDSKHRRCRKCIKVLEKREFANSSTSKDGKQGWCRKCNSDFVRYKRENFDPDAKKTKDSINWATRLLSAARHNSKYHHGFECTLTKEWLEKQFILQDGLCFYFGIPMLKASLSKRNPFQISLDRIDSSRGYFEDNVVLCCFGANGAKNSCELGIFLDFVRAIKEAKIHQCLDRKKNST